MADFTNQIAVVTGASSGVGRAIALALAEQGATVCLVGRKLEALQSVSGSAGSSRFFSYQADLTNDEEIHELAARLQRDVGFIDLLVHSAGVIALGPIEEAPVEDFDRQYRTNVRGPYVLTQALLPMFRGSRGEVVFVNSSIGLSARAGTGQYAATKLALKAIADSLRAEVNAVWAASTQRISWTNRDSDAADYSRSGRPGLSSGAAASAGRRGRRGVERRQLAADRRSYRH